MGPSRHNPVLRWMLMLAVAGFLAVAMAGLLLLRDWKRPYRSFPKAGLIVEIPRGSSRRAIAELLAAKGVVRSAASFRLLALRHHGWPFHAGEYFFDRPLSPQQVVRMLFEGRVYLHAVTVPEGYTMFDIAELLEREGLATRKDFLEAAGDSTLSRDFAPGAPSLEGFLFPDTYKFPRGVRPRRIAETMVRRFREVWSKMPQASNESGLGPLEIVTMASLIERETAVPEERARVASVFYNRLKGGVAFDCDPTVIYALRLEGKYDGTLTSRDLRIDSPYNTYQHRGLPPGPIANPGEASLRAAREPEKTNYFYFVADAEGHHIFSRTLAEHNRNVARYRKKLAAMAREGAREARGSSAPSRQSP